MDLLRTSTGNAVDELRRPVVTDYLGISGLPITLSSWVKSNIALPRPVIAMGMAASTAMMPSFHSADRPTHRRVMGEGMAFCAVFVTISFWLRPQPESGHVLVKADRLVRTAGKEPISGAAAERSIRQLSVRTLVIHRNADEAGKAQHVEQKFHPCWHDANPG